MFLIFNWTRGFAQPMTAKCIKPKYFISDSKAVKTKQIGSREKPKDRFGWCP